MALPVMYPDLVKADLVKVHHILLGLDLLSLALSLEPNHLSIQQKSCLDDCKADPNVKLSSSNSSQPPME